MRRPAVVGWIAVFVLIPPALGAPEHFPPPSAAHGPAAAGSAPGERALRFLAAAHPPVSVAARRRLARAGVLPGHPRAPRAAEDGAVPHRARALAPVVLGVVERVPQAAPSRTAAGAPARGARRAVPRATDPEATRPAAGQTTGRARTYAVRPGDTLWDIARRHGVSADGLAAANGLRSSAVLQPGQLLRVPVSARAVSSTAAARSTAPAAVPRPASTTHVVRRGETLWRIAGAYGVGMDALVAANGIDDPDRLAPGRRLTIPGGGAPRVRQPQAAVRWPAAQAAVLRSGFVWPARGVLTSRFGWRYRRHHNGVDIAAPTGTPIHAARDGVVQAAGWEGGYGRLVRIVHDDGVVTLYGHASTILVRVGQRVKKGQLIARVGCTGWCTGSHVHFEVHVRGQPVNPLRYLR